MSSDLEAEPLVTGRLTLHLTLITGPIGAGKSTVADLLGRRLGTGRATAVVDQRGPTHRPARSHHRAGPGGPVAPSGGGSRVVEFPKSAHAHFETVSREHLGKARWRFDTRGTSPDEIAAEIAADFT